MAITLDPALRAETQLDKLLNEPRPSVLDRERRMAAEVSDADLRRLVLFGAGTLGQYALARLREAGVEPLAFADNNCRLWGQTVAGLPVLSAEQAAARFGPAAAFVVTIYTGRRVLSQLSALGLRAFPFSRLFMKFPGRLFPYWSLNHPDFTLDRSEQVRGGLEVWADEASREEYVAQVRYRLWQNEDLPPSRPAGDIYFPDDLVLPLQDETFVDCGAYDGDSIRSFLERRGGGFRRVIAIEPDPSNRTKLTASTAAMPQSLRERITVKPLAAGLRREQVRFAADGAAWSRVSGAGGLEVECAPMDEILAGEGPSYLKMDIEGAEPDAIAGAARVLREQAPVLAVCLYHKAEHLWEVPMLIRSLNPAYRLFLRRYSDYCWEQVCYAVPPSRLRTAGLRTAGERGERGEGGEGAAA